MDEQWDNDLKKRIAEVFDNYEDTSADEGWLLLREKYPKKAKRRGIIWLWMGSAAAVLLVLLGIFWFRSANNDEQQLAHNKKPTGQTTGQQVAKGNPANIRPTDTIGHQQAESIAKNDISKSAGKNLIQEPKTTPVSAAKGSLAANKKKNSDHIKIKEAVLSPSPNAPGVSYPNKGAIAAVSPEDDRPAQVNQNPGAVKEDTSTKVSAKSYANAGQPGVNMQKEQAKKQQKNIFEDEKLADKQPKVKSPKSDKAVRLGIYAATYFNYAKGSSNQFNMGAGITSDISLSRNIKLSTGLSIGQNTLSYAGQGEAPQQSVQLAAAANTATVNSFTAARTLYTATATTTQFKNYNANLVGLDIPLNLKFVIDPQKSQTYILAGVSSGTFINEKYTYVYDNQSLYSSGISQTQDKSTSSSFNGFYFAKTLNLAFGSGYRVGSNRLVVEPFLKYPLDGLGAQQIKFGAGGINLKFNFQGGKK